MRGITWFTAAVIIAAGLWADSPAWHGQFLWDDPQYVTANPLLRAPAGLARAWFMPGSVMEYYPLQETALWLQWHFFGAQPFGYHLTNALLHVLSALLLWRFFSVLGLRRGWMGGLLFVIHPANVESVAWISELKNTLSLPPFLVAMTALIRFYETRRSRDYGISLTCFALALLVKISMAPFPFAILLYAWWRNHRITWRDVRIAAPFLCVAVVFSALTVFAYLQFGTTHTDHPALPALGNVLVRLTLAITTVSFYFFHTFWPWPLLPIYPPWNLAVAWKLALPLAVLWAAALGGLWAKRATYGRHVLFGLGFFLLFIAPFSGIATQSYMYFAWVMDHFLYIAMIGPIALILAAFEQFRGASTWSGRIALALLTGFVAAMAATSHAYSRQWQSAESLWSYNVAQAPGAWLAHYNLANAYRGEMRMDPAIKQYRASLALHPDYDWAHNNLGICLAETPEGLPTAMDEYRAAIRLRPSFPEAHNNLANAMVEMGRYPEAFPEYRAALAAQPDFIAARYNYALALMKDNQHAEAAVQLHEILRQQPDMDAARFLLEMAQ